MKLILVTSWSPIAINRPKGNKLYSKRTIRSRHIKITLWTLVSHKGIAGADAVGVRRFGEQNQLPRLGLLLLHCAALHCAGHSRIGSADFSAFKRRWAPGLKARRQARRTSAAGELDGGFRYTRHIAHDGEDIVCVLQTLRTGMPFPVFIRHIFTFMCKSDRSSEAVINVAPSCRILKVLGNTLIQ